MSVSPGNLRPQDTNGRFHLEMVYFGGECKFIDLLMLTKSTHYSIPFPSRPLGNFRVLERTPGNYFLGTTSSKSINLIQSISMYGAAIPINTKCISKVVAPKLHAVFDLLLNYVLFTKVKKNKALQNFKHVSCNNICFWLKRRILCTTYF